MPRDKELVLILRNVGAPRAAQQGGFWKDKLRSHVNMLFPNTHFPLGLSSKFCTSQRKVDRTQQTEARPGHPNSPLQTHGNSQERLRLLLALGTVALCLAVSVKAGE